MKAYLIVESNDPKTAEWFYADASWKALDAAKAAGFNETVGFAVVKTMNSKDVDIKFGPHVSLREIAAKRSKRRSITLVRKLG